MDPMLHVRVMPLQDPFIVSECVQLHPIGETQMPQLLGIGPHAVIQILNRNGEMDRKGFQGRKIAICRQRIPTTAHHAQQLVLRHLQPLSVLLRSVVE